MSGGAVEVAIVAPNWLGDAVMCLPAIAALQAAQPDWQLTVLARRAVAPVFAATAMNLGVAVLPEPMSLRLPKLERRADICLIFPNSFYAALLGWRTGARRRIGYARDGRSLLLTQAIAIGGTTSRPPHESFYYLDLLRQAGLIAALPPEAMVPLRADAAAVAAWRARFAEAPILLHAGATYGTAKCWPPERFAALARQLRERGHAVALIGAPGERALAEAIRDRAGAAGIENLAGRTSLPELLALLAGAELLVANDSGPMHLAAAVGTPVVALFGSTNERETYALAEPGRLRIVTSAGVACRPCKLRECPIDHRCMTRIAVERVLDEIERMRAPAG